MQVRVLLGCPSRELHNRSRRLQTKSLELTFSASPFLAQQSAI